MKIVRVIDLGVTMTAVGATCGGSAAAEEIRRAGAQAAHARSHRSGSAALRSTYVCTSGCGRIRKRPSRIAVGDDLGDVLRLDDAVGAAVAELARRHGGVHALRAQDGHADALVAVGDGDGLGQLDARRLGHAVRRRPDRGEQAGCAGGVHEVALATSDHRRQHGPGGVDVGHHVQLPLRLPRLVRRLHAAAGAGTGVGEEDVDRADLALDALDERHDRGLVGDVELDAEAADLLPDRPRGVTVAVGDDDRARPVGHPPTGDRGADPAPAARDDRYPVRDLHGTAP